MRAQLLNLGCTLRPPWIRDRFVPFATRDHGASNRRKRPEKKGADERHSASLHSVCSIAPQTLHTRKRRLCPTRVQSPPVNGGPTVGRGRVVAVRDSLFMGDSPCFANEIFCCDNRVIRPDTPRSHVFPRCRRGTILTPLRSFFLSPEISFHDFKNRDHFPCCRLSSAIICGRVKDPLSWQQLHRSARHCRPRRADSRRR